MPKKIKTELPLPQNDTDLDSLLFQIGELDTNIREIQAAYDKQSKKLTRRFNRQLKPETRKMLILATFVFNYAEMHRDRLTKTTEGKTIVLSSGVVNWRTNPPSVKFLNEKKLIKRLKKLNLSKLIHTKETVKRRELLKWLQEEATRQIDDVWISQEEELALRARQMTKDYKVKRSELPQLEFPFVKAAA